MGDSCGIDSWDNDSCGIVCNITAGWSSATAGGTGTVGVASAPFAISASNESASSLGVMSVACVSITFFS